MNDKELKIKNQIETIKNLSKSIALLKQKSKYKDQMIESLTKKLFINSNNCYQLKDNQKVFIETVTPRGLIRTYTGFVINENKKTIHLLIKSLKGDYSYIISKKDIHGIKVYNEFNIQ